MYVSFTFVLLFVQLIFYYSLWDFVIVVGLHVPTPVHQREDFLLPMRVDIDQWRASMECFLASVRLFPVIKAVHSTFFNVVNACFAFVQCLLCFLPLFARLRRFTGIEEDVFVKVLKRIPLGVIIRLRSKFCLCRDVQFSIASITCFKLHIQWYLRIIPLSDDIKKILVQKRLTLLLKLE